MHSWYVTFSVLISIQTVRFSIINLAFVVLQECQTQRELYFDSYRMCVEP